MVEKIIKKLLYIYYGIFVGGVIIALLGFIFSQNHSPIPPQSNAGITLSSLLIIFVIGSIPLSLYFFNKKLSKWSVLENEELKLKKYEKGARLRLLIIGTGFIIGILFFYVLRLQSMIFCAAIAAVALIFCKPHQQQMRNDLKLEDKE